MRLRHRQCGASPVIPDPSILPLAAKQTCLRRHPGHSTRALENMRKCPLLAQVDMRRLHQDRLQCPRCARSLSTRLLAFEARRRTTLRRIPDVPTNLLELQTGDAAAGEAGAVQLMMVRPICSPQEFESLSRHSGIETRPRTLSRRKQNSRKNLHDCHRLWRTRRAPGTSAGQL
jgi:hypothetical protein